MDAQVLLLRPIAAMFVLTALVWLLMYVRRLSWMAAHKIDPQSVSSPERMNAAVPEAVNAPSNNLKNLFELPVVFYALCGILLATHGADGLYVQAAWAFVALRGLHSLVHSTVNIVKLRFTFYLLSSLMLWFMVGRFALAQW